MYRALLVCNSTFPEDPAGLPALNGPRADGLYLWRALTDPATSMFDPDEVEVLQERTSDEIGLAVERFFCNADRGDVLLFYYSGHGRRTRSRRKLVLCARNSRSDRLETTTVRCEAVNDLIDDSSAETIIVVLDCCYGGAFTKGEEDLAVELKGRGRYVIAAANEGQTAPDAKDPGRPSPFTAVLAAALQTGGFGGSDLDALFDHLSSKVADPQPKRSFDGSGSVEVVKRPDVAERDELRREPLGFSSQGDPGSQRAIAGHFVGTVEHRNLPLRHRALHDLSYGDLSIWAMYLLCGLAQLVAALLLIAEPWQYYSDGYLVDDNDVRNIAALTAASVGVLTVAAAVVQAIAVNGITRRTRSRRRVLMAIQERRLVLMSRRGLHIISTVGALSALTYFQFGDYGDIQTAFAIGVLTLPGAITAAEWTRRGDAAFLAGSVLVIWDAFLPQQASNMSFQSDLPVLAFMNLLVASAMICLWWFRASASFLAASTVVEGAIVISALATRLTIGPVLAAVGVVATLIGVVFGAGVPLSEDINSEFLGPSAALNRLMNRLPRRIRGRVSMASSAGYGTQDPQ